MITISDATERQRARHTLLREQARLQEILNRAPVGCSIVLSGRQWFVNQGLVDIFGVQLGDSHAQLFADSDEYERVCAIWSAATHGVMSAEPARLMTRDGRVIDTLLTWQTYVIESETERAGEVGGALVGAPQPEIALLTWAVDVTSLRETERATSVARLRAEEAAEAKSNFLSNMSHEIRTPMNAIIGLSALALRQPMAPEIEGYLQKISQSGVHLLGIINDILDFSKIESGKLQIEAIEFAVGPVLAHVVDLMGERLEAKGLTLHCIVEPGLPALLIGDPLRIGQILINYVNNAIKFTENGSVRIEVGATQRSARQLTLQVAVTDTGIGLSAQSMSRLFNTFEQADSSTTRQYGGTGLGLAICKELAQAMGGEVGLSSALEMGSCFWFTVTVGIAEASTTQVVHQALDDAAERAITDVLGARLLLVEDNEVNQLVAFETLCAAGFWVDVAANGSLAVESVARSVKQDLPYDLILMDMQMPIMDGVTATRLIRQQFTSPSMSALPIVAMTANVLPEARARCLEAGMNAFVTKPVQTRALWDTLGRLIRPRPGLGTPAMCARPLANSLSVAESAAPLRAIAGLDVDLGLTHTGAGVAFYKNMLRRFAVGQSDALQRLDAALAEQDFALAERFAHTLKGVAATIGAQPTQAAAEALEQALRAPTDVMEVGRAQRALVPVLAQLLASLAAHQTALAPFSGAQHTVAETPQTDACASESEAQMLMAELRVAVQHSDMAAIDLWEKSWATFHHHHPSAALLEHAIAQFDFEKAAALLNE